MNLGIQALCGLLLLLLLGQPVHGENAIVHGENMIVHGSTVLIYPSPTSLHPKDARLETINFYCYVGPTGYFSFGWFLGGDPHGVDTSRCTPNASRFDWWEYAAPNPGLDCSGDMLKCRTHSVGFLAGWDGRPDRPMVDDDYRILGFRLGERPQESLWTSYYDRPGGMFAVGVRRATSRAECEAAYATLLRLFAGKKPPIGFELTDPCRKAGDGGKEEEEAEGGGRAVAEAVAEAEAPPAADARDSRGEGDGQQVLREGDERRRLCRAHSRFGIC